MKFLPIMLSRMFRGTTQQKQMSCLVGHLGETRQSRWRTIRSSTQIKKGENCIDWISLIPNSLIHVNVAGAP
jgi:hypothetical protein